MQHAWGDMKIHTKFWSENLNGNDHSKDLETDRKVILEWILGKKCGKVCIEFVWLRMGSSGGLL
jgi:hypothetical protein